MWELATRVVKVTQVAIRVVLAHLVIRVVTPVVLDLLDILVVLDLLGTLVVLAIKDILAVLDLLALLVRQVPYLARKDHQAVILVQQVKFLDLKALEDIQEVLVILVKLDLQVVLVKYLAQLAHKDLQGVIPVQLGLKVHKALLVVWDIVEVLVIPDRQALFLDHKVFEVLLAAKEMLVDTLAALVHKAFRATVVA
jgi:hypothetical protein